MRQWRSAARVTLVGASASAILSMPGSAQEQPAGNASAPGFWVTEAGYSHSVSGPCSDHYPSFEIGKLFNLGGPVAVGGTFFVGHNAEPVFGPLPRLRYWSSDDLAFDAAAGFLFGARRVRPTTYLSMNYRDFLAAFVQYERYRDGGCGRPTENQLFFGVKVGSRPGLITAGVGAAVAAIVIAVVVSQIEN